MPALGMGPITAIPWCPGYRRWRSLGRSASLDSGRSDGAGRRCASPSSIDLTGRCLISYEKAGAGPTSAAMSELNSKSGGPSHRQLEHPQVQVGAWSSHPEIGRRRPTARPLDLPGILHELVNHSVRRVFPGRVARRGRTWRRHGRPFAGPDSGGLDTAIVVLRIW